MSSPILVTKLFIPTTRPEIVPRPRLIKRLNSGLHRKLTLISAPAGFGKTTLVTEWLDNLRGDTQQEDPTINRIAWLSLDDGDNDPTRFLTYFVAALNQIEGIEATLGKGSLDMLQSPQPPTTEAVLTPLINEITAIPDQVFLVLDDYHLIDAQPVHDTLNFLLENLPSHLHLVIATREDPLLPLSRLRAREQLTELRAADLRFSSTEAAEFLNHIMGLTLSKEDIASLEIRTEGWIAGLQLAALALQGTISSQGQADISKLIQSFTGTNRLVLDYLIEEVLSQQSEDIQTFLLQTALLERLNSSLCNTLTGSGNSQAILEMLDRANLFIVPLDNERRWYRYHHLFADLLRQRLSHIQPEQVDTLHQRASEWYEQHGFMDDAIEHVLVIEDFDRAAYLIDQHADTLWQHGEHRKLPRLLDKVPIELIYFKPQLCVFHAWYSFIHGQQEMTKQCLQAAERALDINSDPFTEAGQQQQAQLSDPQKELLLGRIAAIRAFMDSFRGDVPGLIQHSRQALEYLPERERIWRSITALTLGDMYGFIGDMPASYEARFEAYRACRTAGDTYYTMLASSKLAITLRAQGRLQQTLDLCEEQIQAAREFGYSQSPLNGFLLVLLGEALAEINDLDKALDLVVKGIDITEHRGNLVFVGWGYVSLIRIQFSKGDLAAVEAIIQKMENMTRESNVPAWIMRLMMIWQVRTWLVQSNLDAASQWVRDCELSTDVDALPLQEIDFFSLFDYIVLARILIAQGQLDESIKLLEHLLIVADSGGRIASMIEILMLQALAFQKLSDPTRSMSALKQSLTLAELGGFIRIFVDEGPPMARLLYDALSQGISPDYVQRLLAAFPDVEPEQANASKIQTPEAEWIEPLSERELDVLQLIAEGLTNQEIASKLYLSLNTVKAHTRAIYSKLGVNSRTQATARARLLGLLIST